MTALAAVGVTKRYGDLTAVDEVSIEIRPEETVALVGESGSGKSTLGRLLVGLEPPDGGAVTYAGAPIRGLKGPARRTFRRAVQIIFQDPYASLNPRLTVGSAIREVLAVHEIAAGNAAAAKVSALLDRVGLDEGAARRYPHEFSGGQRQRIGIARALAVEPRILVADEPVSALDVSVQARILGLLSELRRDMGLGILFISHDLAVVRRMADRVAVMRAGRVVEVGPSKQVYANPGDPYTRALLAAVPTLPKAT
ncbi:MAG: ATP-binding cassette domain-containing protein [Gemmatimonadota bacterium]|nr:ATP-binding cassette domain-containing protein [Gemmatimonadota bacterium]